MKNELYIDSSPPRKAEDFIDRSHIWTPPAFTLPAAPLGDPSDRMRLANAIAASLEADPALVDDLRNALTDRVATRLHRDWKRADDERSHVTNASLSDAAPFFRPG